MKSIDFSKKYIIVLIQMTILVMEHVPSNFPNFKNVTLDDREIFEDYTSRFEFIADYNFNNFYSWNVKGSHSLCKLNDNLVLRFSDYVSGRPFLSLMGDTNLPDTILLLFDFIEKNNYDPGLKLVSESSTKKLSDLSTFAISEDNANHDYLFSISEIAHMSGRHYKNKRQAARKCGRLNNINLVDGIINDSVRNEINALFMEWHQIKSSACTEIEASFERKAINRMLDISPTQENVLLTLAYSNGNLVGFSIDELLSDTMVLSHYLKTLPNYHGLTELLNQKVAQKLESLNYKIWNWQQDLGIENLRKMKLGYRPSALIKKYTIEKL